MGIELVCNENPWVVWRCVYCLLDMRNKVRLGAGLAHAWSDLLTRRNFEVGSQALGAVTNVFVFLALDLTGLACDAWLHRFCGICALKRLDAGFLIRAHKMDTLHMQRRCLLVKIAHSFDLLIKLWCVSFRSIEPIFNPIWF